MSALIAATQPARTIVIERGGGGTPWWALLVALAAAVASYCATWQFKRRDVERENAFRSAELIDEASRTTSTRDGFANAGGPSGLARLLYEAGVRAQPLDDADVNDRFEAARNFATDMELWGSVPERARSWAYEAILNVRAALVPYLAAPRLIGKWPPPERSFPTRSELSEMPKSAHVRDGTARLDALDAWKKKPGRKEGAS
jgi:hypothetical protein